MSDAQEPPAETRAQHEAEWTAEPQYLRGPASQGPVLYRVANDDDGFAGFVFVALAVGSGGRAGMVLAHRPSGPSKALQDQLGPALLAVHPTINAFDALDDLYVEQPLELGEVQRAEDRGELERRSL